MGLVKSVPRNSGEAWEQRRTAERTRPGKTVPPLVPSLCVLLVVYLYFFFNYSRRARVRNFLSLNKTFALASHVPPHLPRFHPIPCRGVLPYGRVVELSLLEHPEHRASH